MCNEALACEHCLCYTCDDIPCKHQHCDLCDCNESDSGRYECEHYVVGRSLQELEEDLATYFSKERINALS